MSNWRSIKIFFYFMYNNDWVNNWKLFIRIGENIFKLLEKGLRGLDIIGKERHTYMEILDNYGFD